MKELQILLKSMSKSIGTLTNDFEALTKRVAEIAESQPNKKKLSKKPQPPTKKPNDISERSYQKVTKADLKKLLKIAHEDRKDFFQNHPRWKKLYSDRMIAIALCQGAALHYLNGKNGVKDFDVWTFYSEHPSAPFPYRRMGGRDFGSTKFGRHPSNADRYKGRGVDLLGRSLKCSKNADPVKMIRDYLKNRETKSANELSKKAVVMLFPENLFGKVIWP